MEIYHGSFVTVEQPKIIKNEVGRDFGFAFYTTDIYEQACRWANRKAMIEHRRGNINAQAIVSVFEWNEKQADNELDILRFTGPDITWLEMVLKCRNDKSYKHNYDIVIGNIADDNVGETVSYVIQGIMRKEDAIERLKFEKINNQIAFCTERSLDTIKFCESRNVSQF